MKYIGKLKWIFKKQLGQYRERTFELSQVLTIIDDIEIPSFVKDIIKKGLSYAMWEDKSILEDIPIFESLLSKVEQTEEERLRWSFINQKDRVKHTCKNREARYERSLIRKTFQRMRENQYIITKEDKMKKMVLMMKQKYESFLLDYINEIKPEQLSLDPTDNIARKINNIVKNKNFPQFWKVQKSEAPVALRLFAYIKSHKTPVEARPIVEKRNAPTYQLERAIAKWRNSILGETETSTIVVTSVLSKIKCLDVL